MCDSNTTRRVHAAHLAAQAAQQLADIYKWCSCCDQTLQTVLCRRQTSVNTKTTLIRFASYLSHRLIAIYMENYKKLLKLIIIMYNMTGIAKFYNNFVIHRTGPDPTRPAGRPDPRATLLILDYSTKKNGVHAFGYNSAESERMWMKSGALWVHCWGLAQADFGHDPRSSDSLRGGRNLVYFCPLNNARFYRFTVG